MNAGRITVVVLIVFLAQSCSDDSVPNHTDRALSYEFLMHGTSYEQFVQLSEFTRPADAVTASNTFSGRLRLTTDSQNNNFRVLVDELGLVDLDRPGMQDLPPFDFEFVQANHHIIPVRHGPIANDHNWWEYVLMPGPVWDEETDRGFSRAVIPFALKERREDCIHNGLMSFLFNDQGEVSKLAFQFSNQTCRYLQFEFSGLLSGKYVPADVADRERTIAAFNDEISHRMSQRPIAQLAVDYAGADPTNFGSIEEIAAQTMTVYGFVIDNVHYVGGCNTLYGDFPYCDFLALPSYSTAKSFVGGLALMRAEKLFPGTASALIKDYVPECSVGWEGVTIEHALDMTTGHYASPVPHVDEDAAIVSRFFTGEDHATKIDFACNEFPRRSEPGEVWVYQTWATYLAGTAIDARLKSLAGPDADMYDDLIVKSLWKPLHLSALSHSTRRTNDAVAQPFTGFGLTLQRDDIAKLAVFLGVSDGRIDGEEVLDRDLFDAIKQRNPNDPGLTAESDRIRYNNGFRTFDVSEELGCDSPTWLTTMSGFGGINIVLMPNDTAYYYFSDGNVHRYLFAVRESHRIRPMC